MRVSELYRLARVLREVALAASREGADEGASAAHVTIVEDVSRHPKSPIGAVAKRTGLAQSFVSRTVDDLVDAGVFERIRDPSDGRRSLIALGTQGQAQIERRADKNVEEAIAQSFPLLTGRQRSEVVGQLALLSSVLCGQEAACPDPGVE